MSDVDALLAEIQLSLSETNWEKARGQASAARDRFPERAEFRHCLGQALRGLGRPEESLEAYLESIHLQPSLDVHLDVAELLIDELGDDVHALHFLRSAAQFAEDPRARAEVALLRAVAMAHLQDFTGALRVLREARLLDPQNPDVILEEGAVLLELLRLAEAEDVLREAIAMACPGPRAHQLLAFLLDYSGRRDESLEHFAAAASMSEGLPKRPLRLSEESFDAAVTEARQAMPTRLGAYLDGVEVASQNYPDREFCRRHDCGPMTLSVFVGTPLSLREGKGSELPDRIVLFQRSLENACVSRDQLIMEIVTTLQHEVGHLLGLDAHQLHEAGLV